MIVGEDMAEAEIFGGLCVVAYNGRIVADLSLRKNDADLHAVPFLSQ